MQYGARPVPPDPHHRDKYATGWRGWKNEWKSGLLLVGGLVLFGLVLVGVMFLVSFIYN